MRKDRMKDNKKNNFAKRAGNTFFWAIVIAIILGVFWSSQNFFSARLKDVPISDVIARANKGEISKFMNKVLKKERLLLMFSQQITLQRFYGIWQL